MLIAKNSIRSFKLACIAASLIVLLGIPAIAGDNSSETMAALPRVGGQWNLSGEGTWGGIPARDVGTVEIITEIRNDGREYLKRIVYNGTITVRGFAPFRDSFDVRSDEGILVSERFGIRMNRADGVVIFDFTLINDTRFTGHRTGRIDGEDVDAIYTFIKAAVGGGGEGGGCSTAGVSSYGLLLAAPLLLLLRRK